MFTPSKYWVAHPRCLAACSISGDSSLSERFCCWTCHLPSKKSEGEGHYKSLWPTLDDFIWHWCHSHACDAHFDWDSVAIHLGLTCEDLAFTLLSIDLGATPLPTKPEAIAVLPDLLPPRPQGHNVLIFAKPWYRLQEGGFRYVAKPPSYPPPHVKDSQHVGPIRPLPPSSSGNVAFKEWLLVAEEHAFYLFAVKVLASRVMATPSILKPSDREMVLIMERVHSSDLVDELGFVRTFRYRNDMSIYVAAVISHVRSIIELRVPLPDGYSFPRAPAWDKLPQKGLAPILFKMPSH